MSSCKIINIIQVSMSHNRTGSFCSLLSWLKNQLYRSVKPVLNFHQNLCYTQADRRMSIMTAAVHHSRIPGSKSLCKGSVIYIFILCQTKSINVKTESCHRPFSAPENSNHTGKARSHLLCQIFCRSPLQKSSFCMLLQFL